MLKRTQLPGGVIVASLVASAAGAEALMPDRLAGLHPMIRPQTSESLWMRLAWSNPKQYLVGRP